MLVAAMALFAGAGAVAAAPERVVPLDAVKLETIRIEGLIQTWVVEKVCIDGQAYLLVFGATSLSGIAPSFKDGKPEQCPAKPAK